MQTMKLSHLLATPKPKNCGQVKNTTGTTPGGIVKTTKIIKLKEPANQKNALSERKTKTTSNGLKFNLENLPPGKPRPLPNPEPEIESDTASEEYEDYGRRRRPYRRTSSTG